MSHTQFRRGRHISYGILGAITFLWSILDALISPLETVPDGGQAIALAVDTANIVFSAIFNFYRFVLHFKSYDICISFLAQTSQSFKDTYAAMVSRSRGRYSLCSQVLSLFVANSK